MPAPVRWLLSAGLLLQGSPTPPKTWIADLKVNREQLGAKAVLLEGNVAEIRSTSPAARAGFYRIIDATDPEGVLLHTNRLPRQGGTLRVLARLAAQQPGGSPPLLDELDQQRVARRPLAPLVLGTVSLGTLLLVMVLLVRAVRAERRLRPPLWLLPEAGPYGTALGSGDAHQLALWHASQSEGTNRIRRAQLRRRKRRLFRVMLGAIGGDGLSLVWLVITRPASAQVPQFVFLPASDTLVMAAKPTETGSRDSTPDRVDSVKLALEQSTPVEEKSSRPGGAADSIEKARTRDQVKRPVLPPITPVKLPDLNLLTPTPAPAPAPREEERPRDPESDRTVAIQQLTSGAEQLVDAINSRQFDRVELLLAESLAGDLKRRERFLNLLKRYPATAVLETIEGPTLAENRGEARFTLRLEWRGEFETGYRKIGQFTGLMSRNGGNWRFDGVRLITPVP